MIAPAASSPAFQQLVSFLEAVSLGLLFAFLYDFYRALRSQLLPLTPLISVSADFFVWLIAAVAAVIFFVYRRWGELFIYIYIGLAVGFVLYFCYLSRYVLPLWGKGFGFIARLYRRLAAK